MNILGWVRPCKNNSLRYKLYIFLESNIWNPARNWGHTAWRKENKFRVEKVTEAFSQWRALKTEHTVWDRGSDRGKTGRHIKGFCIWFTPGCFRNGVHLYMKGTEKSGLFYHLPLKQYFVWNLIHNIKLTVMLLLYCFNRRAYDFFLINYRYLTE